VAFLRVIDITMANSTTAFTTGTSFTFNPNGQIGINNTNPQYTLDVSGVLNLNTGGGINNLGTYINPPLILASGGNLTGLASNYSYVVSSGSLATTGYLPPVSPSNLGQEISFTSKGAGLTITGTAAGVIFFNTGALVSGFSIPSGTTRFGFGDGTHWNFQ